LILPIIGSLIILSYPYISQIQTNKINESNIKQNLPLVTSDKVQATPTSYIFPTVSGNKIKESSVAIKELIDMPNIDKQNSNLKKIAIITSLINFFVSLLL